MSAFTDAVKAAEGRYGNISSGVSPGCVECMRLYGYESEEKMQADWECGKITEEPHFSWRPCQCCESGLGGDRHEAHGVLRDADGNIEVEHLSICVDCMLFTANGDEPENWAE